MRPSHARYDIRSIAEKVPRLRRGECNRTTPQDLRLLYDAYDQHVFSGGLKLGLGGRPLNFRWSSRMTRTAGTSFTS